MLLVYTLSQEIFDAGVAVRLCQVYNDRVSFLQRQACTLKKAKQMSRTAVSDVTCCQSIVSKVVKHNQQTSGTCVSGRSQDTLPDANHTFDLQNSCQGETP